MNVIKMVNCEVKNERVACSCINILYCVLVCAFSLISIKPFLFLGYLIFGSYVCMTGFSKCLSLINSDCYGLGSSLLLSRVSYNRFSVLSERVYHDILIVMLYITLMAPFVIK